MSDEQTAQRFIEALRVLERERDSAPIAGMFGADSDVGNIVTRREFRGAKGAREFWETYRGTFGEMESSFHNVIVGDGSAALEWSTSGTSVSGDPIAYDGVSILEIADGQIMRFRAYFDPGGLGHQMEAGARAEG